MAIWTNKTGHVIPTWTVKMMVENFMGIEVTWSKVRIVRDFTFWNGPHEIKFTVGDLIERQ